MISWESESIPSIPPASEEEKTHPAPSEGPSVEAGSSSRKRTSVVWTDFDRVLVDGVFKAKCKKCAKLYSCASTEGTGHLKRHQESHRVSESHLQSTLNV